MTTTDIKRVALQPVGEVSDMDEQLSQEAIEVLGWKQPDAEEHPVNPLRKALAECGIEILDWRDVLQYKMEKRQEAERRAVAGAQASDRPPRWFSTPDWSSSELQHHRGAIPQHVVSKMVQLKRALPEVTYKIDALMSSPDPFLIACFGKSAWDSDYVEEYIEVWDERDLNGGERRCDDGGDSGRRA